MRKTKSVDALLKVFEESDEAISMMELLERLQDKMNRTTVYRILQRLESHGMLHSFMGKEGLRWYALGQEVMPREHRHPHFQCKDCGKMECLPTQLSIPNIPNHKIESVSLLFIGHCGKCDK